MPLIVAKKKAITAAGYASAVLADSPTIYYKMNETSGTTATDSSPNAKHGTISGTPVMSVAGDAGTGTAIQFDGTDDRIVSPTLGTAHTNWTIEFFANPAASPAQYDRLVSIGNGTFNGVDVAVKATDLNIEFLDAAWGTLVGAVLTATTRRHYAFTYNGTTLKVYQDGTEIYSGARGRTIPSTSTVTLATPQDLNYTYGWAGVLDEFAIYPTALSQARVQAHYDARGIA